MSNKDIVFVTMNTLYRLNKHWKCVSVSQRWGGKNIPDHPAVGRSFNRAMVVGRHGRLLPGIPGVGDRLYFRTSLGDEQWTTRIERTFNLPALTAQETQTTSPALAQAS